ncbi:aminopeptidase P N-terminal domain-containing protein [Mesobacillus subterraneus]|uniref:aminopeptidase P N-terminal domain-containing protein n=1 Tax=Mesobacillus subterraneus TaxID=285983 RepID=UPI001CFE7DB4|nr:aminopeptidase P N-terminal domain-containing protein [Mesobacillus subterraneus]WLR57287.1 aminopeptidase P N-terminal domain-containing protein [Mesobacillus subterraneus]
MILKRKIFRLPILASMLLLGGCVGEETKEQAGSVSKPENGEAKPTEVTEDPKDDNKSIAVSLPEDFFQKNRSNLIEKMEDGSILVLFSERIYGTEVKNNDMTDKEKLGAARNFYYLTGIKDSESVLMIKKDGSTAEEKIFVPAKSEKVTKVSKIEEVQEIEKFQEVFDTALEGSKILYVDAGDPMLMESVSTEEQKKAESQAKAQNLEIKNIFPVLGEMRSIKTGQEIEIIKSSIAVTKEGIDSMMKISKNGIEESVLEDTFFNAISKAGTDRTSFDSIIASGENAIEAHYMENDDAAPEDGLILTDVGAEVGYYSADITRTFPADGTFSDRQKELYNIVLKAQEEVINQMKPGTDLGVLFETANNILSEELIKIGLINDASELSNYFAHGLFHPIGLDVHDVSGYNTTLEPGMVFAIEPGLYIPEEKIGIRIEDNVLVTEEGHIVLSKEIIKTVDEIEEFMKKK